MSYVDVDVWCGDTRVERLRLREGETFEAEVHCDDYRLEVVGVDGEGSA